MRTVVRVLCLFALFVATFVLINIGVFLGLRWLMAHVSGQTASHLDKIGFIVFLFNPNSPLFYVALTLVALIALAGKGLWSTVKKLWHV
ncbi:MAG: hypothetical protein JST11_17970 [Acidobacteria bacterium]|nr:hypothetical protein [Acidobacteriota bacterium]